MSSRKPRLVRHLMVLAGVAAVAVALVSASGANAASPVPSQKQINQAIKGQRFIMIIQGSGDASKVVEAHVIKILQQMGVNASIRYNPTSSNVAIAQLMSGAADAFSAAPAAIYGAAVAGVPLVDFALLEPREDYTFISRPDITSIAQLKGKNIGVLDTTSINYPQALIVLKRAHLGPKDANFVTAGGQSSRFAALVAGRIDATMLSHLSWLQLQSQGYHLLFDYTKQAPSLYDDNLGATASWLSSHRDLAIAVNEAVLKSYAWFDNPKNANAVVQEALALEPKADPTQLSTLFDILRKNHGYLAGQILNLPTLEYMGALFEQLGAVKGHAPIGKWANVYYAKTAKKLLYPPKQKKK